MSERGEVISLGSNEVPKPGGGTYWCDDPDQIDNRDYVRGLDENEHIRRGILADLLRRLGEGKFVSSEQGEIENLVSRVIASSRERDSVIRESLFMDILEFSRIIHAEMSAISDAARLGQRRKDALLFCTTFPCHMCAKHIIAAGLKQVIFIEPYPKSYAEQLHDDAMVVDVSPSSHPSKVVFSPFIGISPRRYQDVFSRRSRKNATGHFQEWSAGEPRPIAAITSDGYMRDELTFIKLFRERATAIKVRGVEIDGLENSDETIASESAPCKPI